MHTETGPSQIHYQWQPSVAHDVTSPCSSKGSAPPLGHTIDMPLPEQQQASSSSALTRVFRRLSNHVTNAVHGNTEEKQEPPSPVSTAVAEEDVDGFYLNDRPPYENRRSAKSCLAAMFMITIGTLLALAFIMIGLGKALTTTMPNDTITSSVAMTPTSVLTLPTS
ncbi:hypothetical protein BJV82DRAFT_673502 [Fennellomyces sp. T-0311]|nr:hypothetical protein BJV82DRAFT_673502 [Fennellomyces sp. T-0311]